MQHNAYTNHCLENARKKYNIVLNILYAMQRVLENYKFIWVIYVNWTYFLNTIFLIVEVKYKIIIKWMWSIGYFSIHVSKFLCLKWH